jgi:FkbM family methyltransferase
MISLIDLRDSKGPLVQHSEIGRIFDSSSGRRIAVKKGEAGWMLFGPYARLPTGKYIVEFDIKMDPSDESNGEICIVDVATDSGTRRLAEQRLTASDLKGSGGRIPIAFKVDKRGVFEFRIEATGGGAFSANIERPLRRVDEVSGEVADIFSLGEAVENPFYTRHSYEFDFLEDHGFTFQIDKANVIANFRSTRFHVSSREDLQVMREIFVFNEYNIGSSRNKLVIDIGMNAGLASLFFTRDPSVVEVHSFEPFSLPYSRALTNFALNPDDQQRIRPHQLGLGRRDEQVQVNVSSEATIGISVKGTDQGQVEIIQIRDAANFIAPLAERARRDGLDLIIKMDCEGSEFDIFETLVANDLLSSINAIVIEWHKWWSPDKSQMNLVIPLQEAGFIVIDKTDTSNPHAGLVYAARYSG